MQATITLTTQLRIERSHPILLKLNRRYAFTLIEMLVAMGLSAFLMLAIFQTFFAATQYRMNAGRSSEAIGSRVLLLRDLANDLRFCVSAPPKNVRPSQPNAKSNFQSLPSTLRSRLSFQDSFQTQRRVKWVSFQGEPHYCAFQIHSNQDRFSRSPLDVALSNKSLVIWWLNEGAPLRLDGWIADGLPLAKTIGSPERCRGLVRTRVDVDGQGNEIITTELINPDVSSIEFAYFGQVNLQSTWSQSESDSIPRAVRVRMALSHGRSEDWIDLVSGCRRSNVR